MKPRHLVTVGRALQAHDVRRLKLCGTCGGMGYGPDMLNVDGALVHQECYMRKHRRDPVAAVLALPAEERAKLRLDAVGPAAMAALLKPTAVRKRLHK